METGKIQTLRDKGYSEDQISQWATEKRNVLIQKGYSNEKIDEWLGSTPVPDQTNEPPPFNIDGSIREWEDKLPMQDIPEKRVAMTDVLGAIARPFLAQGYSTAASINRGLATFSEHLNAIDEWGAKHFGLKSGADYKAVADTYESNEKFWRARANAVGVNAIDELIGEAVGGAPAGIGEFALGVPYAAILGASEASQRGENEFTGAFLEGMKRGVLGGIFHALDPLKQYLRMPLMGTVFGIQNATAAEDGKGPEGFAKGFGTGALYSITTPGGAMGLNEIRANMRKEIGRQVDLKQTVHEIQKQQETMTAEQYNTHANGTVDSLIREGKAMPFEKEKLLNQMLQPVTPETLANVKDNELPGVKTPEKILEGDTKPRQFLKTVEESMTSQEALKEGVKGIEPQEYVVAHNAESMAAANKRISEGLDTAEKYAKDIPMTDPEKGPSFIALIDHYQKIGQIDKAIELTEYFDVQARGAGRFVQAASIYNRLTPQGFIRWAEKEVNKINANRNMVDNFFGGKRQGLTQQDKEYLFQEMLKVNKMPEGIDKTNATLNLINYVAKKVPPSASEIFDAYRYQNMLSGFRTQERNIGTNIFNTFITRPWDIGTKGAIDFIESTLTGKEREAYVSDVPAYMKNTFNAIPNAIIAFKEAWKGETAIEKPEMGTIEGKGLLEKARANLLPKSLTIVSRFMEASDRFNSTLISAGEFELQKRNGLSDAEAFAKAHDVAESYLFRSKLNPLDPNLSLASKALSAVGQAVQGMRKAPVIGKAAGWFVPFIRTPVNVGIQMIEHSPIGAIRGHWDNEIAARLVNGSIVTALGAIFALNNQTTFSAPTGDKEKEWFYATGRKPFSVQIGNKWIPFWYLGPFALAFAIPAAVKWYTTDSKHSLTNDALDNLAEIAGGIGKFIASQTSVSGISTFYSLVDGEIDFSLPKQLGYIVGQAIPVSSLLRQVSTMLDPVFRQAKGFKESIMASIPLLSKELPAYMEPFGEEAKRDFTNSLIPYDIGTMNKDYEEMYPTMQYKFKADYLKSKINGVRQQLRKGEISQDEAIKKYNDIGDTLGNLQE